MQKKKLKNQLNPNLVSSRNCQADTALKTTVMVWIDV